MRVEEGDRIKFTYTDAKSVTENWEGKVTRADPGKDYFKVATGDAFSRTFRYDRVEGDIEVLTTA